MVDWNYYDKFEELNNKYLPDRGEGKTVATQIVTAVNKLVYKWYNDGDVFDNTYALKGWANDLSSYANWLIKYTETSNILWKIKSCNDEDDYEQLLKELADRLFDKEYLEKMNKIPMQDSIYDCDGPFQFVDEEEDEDYWDDDDED